MSDLRYHVVVGRRLIAGWCANVCTSAFFLDHAVRVGFAGSAVLVFSGVCAFVYTPASGLLRHVGLVNAATTLVDQLRYSAFWSSPAAIAAFVDPHQQHGGQPHQQHVLHGCGVCPNALLVAGVAYHAVFAALFVCALALEPTGSLQFGYALGAASWHAWLGTMIGWSVVLGAVLNRRTNATAQELQKLVGVRPTGVTAELPIAQEQMLPLPRQAALPPSQPQVAPSGLFKFDQLVAVGVQR